MSDRLPALFAAQAVALSARTGALTQNAVDDMRTRAEELLPRGDDLRAAILSFATMYEDCRRDAGALAMQGRILDAALSRALNPEAGPRDRRDIDG